MININGNHRKFMEMLERSFRYNHLTSMMKDAISQTSRIVYNKCK